MASPPRAIPISTSPRPSRPIDFDALISGTPQASSSADVRTNARAQYLSGSPAIPNIPAYSGGGENQARSGTPARLSASNTRVATPNRTLTPSNLPLPGPGSISSSPAVRVGLLSAKRPKDEPTSPDLTTEDTDVDNAIDEDEATRVLRRHLVSKDERNNDADSQNPVSDTDISRKSSMAFPKANAAREESDEDQYEIEFGVPGADVTHDIYKWQSRRPSTRQRAVSYAGVPTAQPPEFEHIHEPGGFRRNYVILQAHEQGEVQPVVSRNFIEFLYLFGHFAGEDLEEPEDEDELEQALAAPPPSALEAGAVAPASERTPLLRRGTSLVRRRKNSIGPTGEASVTEAVLMLLKGFVGTGVLFLGKAFYNGGILFSTLTLAFICLISLYSFMLLVKAKFVVHGSFGDIGGKLYGNWLRIAILSSITISQIGFVSAYTIFIAQNLQAFVMAITNCLKFIPIQYFILMQLVVLLPFSMIRNLAKLSTTALIADAFILAGLIYIFGSEGAVISRNGIAHVELFNPKDFPLFIGTAVFSFEGIGLVVPITDSMKEPHKFPKVMSGVMFFLLFLFGGAGALSYLAFGDKVETVVILNLDADDKFVQAVQFMYAFAILLSVPLQLFPAVRIIENGLFTRSGKTNFKVKWLKNTFRFTMVIMCSLVSWVGAADLDKFVAFVGSFACVPLCFIYPAMLHYKACAHTRKQKLADLAMILFGVIASIYTTVQTIKLMLEPSGGPPKFGHCDTPDAP